MKKKALVFFVLLFVPLLLTVHCGKKDIRPLAVFGSTTIEPFMRRAVADFTKKRDITIQINAVGSKSGIDSLIAEKCDIAMSSMEILPEQIAEAKSKGIALKPFLLGYDIIVPIVHPSNKVENISFDELKEIYQGTITRWAALGGKDSAIEVVDRAHSSGTYNVWHHTVIPVQVNDSLYTIKKSNSSVLAYISENENAIGYVSAAYLNPEVKPLKLDGIAITTSDSLLTEYHLKRPLFLYVDEERFDNSVKLFIIYLIINDRGKELLSESGFFYNSWVEHYHPELP